MNKKDAEYFDIFSSCARGIEACARTMSDIVKNYSLIKAANNVKFMLSEEKNIQKQYDVICKKISGSLVAPAEPIYIIRLMRSFRRLAFGIIMTADRYYLKALRSVSYGDILCAGTAEALCSRLVCATDGLRLYKKANDAIRPIAQACIEARSAIAEVHKISAQYRMETEIVGGYERIIGLCAEAAESAEDFIYSGI